MKKLAGAIALAIAAIVAVALWPYPDKVIEAPSYPVPDAIAPERPTPPDANQSAVPSNRPADESDAQTPVSGTLISGKARYRDTGEPVEGVLVRAYDEHKDDIHSATTHADGAYAFLELNPSDRGVDIWLAAQTGIDGYHAEFLHESKRLFPGDQWTGHDIAIIRNSGVVTGTVFGKQMRFFPERISGLVDDLMSDFSNPATEEAWARVAQEDKAPMDNVRVLARWNTSRLFPQPHSVETISDADGRFRFEELPPGHIQLQAFGGERAVSVATNNGAHAQTAVKLEHNDIVQDVELVVQADAQTVSGYVRDESGVPISNATVHAQPLPQHQAGVEGFRETRNPVSTITDPDGHYELPSLHPADFREVWAYLARGLVARGKGAYLIRAEAEGFAPNQVAVPMLQEETVDFTVKLHNAAMPIMRERAARNPGSNQFQGFETPVRRPTRIIEDHNLPSIDFVLKPEAIVSGYVMDTAGARQPNVNVSLISTGKTEDNPVGFGPYPAEIPRVEASQNGEFRIAGVPEGEHRFEVMFSDGVTQEDHNDPIQVLTGGVYENVAVVVESASDRGHVTGALYDAVDRSPITDFSVNVDEIKTDGEPSPRYGAQKLDKESGRFRISGISQGLATLRFTAPGYASGRIPIQIERGATSEIEVLLYPEARIIGHITDHGEPAGAWVTIPHVSGAYAQAGDDGYYEMKDLKPENYLVKFSREIPHSDRGTNQVHEWRHVTVTQGSDTVVDVDFSGDAEIEGSFRGPSGLRWMVRVLDHSLPGDDPQRAGTWNFEQRGHYRIVGLPAGDYTVVGVARAEDGHEIQESREVTLGPAQTVIIDFAL